MSPKEMAKEIYIRYSLMKDATKTEYIADEKVAFSASLIAIDLLTEQCKNDQKPRYTVRYWEDIRKELIILATPFLLT